MYVARLSSSVRTMSTKVAVVLSGCGVYDGAEVHESSAVLTHLSRHGVQAACFAPDKVSGPFSFYTRHNCRNNFNFKS